MNDNKVKNLVITAFFTAITFLGIQSFRIPLPAAVAPKTFVETAVKCLIVGALFMMLKKKADGDKKKEYGAAVVCAFIYGCINVIMEFTMSTIAMMMVGSGFAAAAVAAFTSLPATVINAVFMVIAIAILYQPVKKIYVRMA